MGEKLPTYHGPLTEISRPQQRPSIINIESSYDLEYTDGVCWWPCEGTISQKLINYEFTLQNRLFRVRNMWASVCDNCNEVYIAPKVDKQIEDITFRRLYPKEARVAKLIEQMQSSTDPISNSTLGV